MEPQAMTRKEPRVKLTRLIILFVIVNAGLAGLVFLIHAFLLSLPTLEAIGWHARHGNKFVLEGHTFHVPLRWNCTLSHYNEWELSEDHPFAPGLSSSVTLSSAGPILDEAAISRLEANEMTQQMPSGLGSKSIEIIRGKQLEFHCMRMDMERFGDVLFCHVPNTKISVSTTASAKYEIETRAILETSD
jgi:hypothetical protein